MLKRISGLKSRRLCSEIRTMKSKRYSLIFIIFLMLSNCAARHTEVVSFEKPSQPTVIQKTEDKKDLLNDNSTVKVDKPVVYKDYHIRPGDQMEISVFGEPDMQKRIIVQPDGKLSYFLVGEINAVGMSFAELRKELENRLSRFILSPSVTIIGEKYEGNYITILGAVQKPGRHSVYQSDTVLDAIARAQGLKFVYSDDFSFAGDIANLKLAYLSRNGKLMDVDFLSLLDMGDMSQNINVEVGDFIHIPTSTSQQVFVLGEVNFSRSIPYRGTTTLLEAITTAGGFNESTACKRSICIVNGSLANPEVKIVNFNRIAKGKELNVVLEPGDIVFVPSTFVTDIERISGKIFPFLNSILLGDDVLDVGQRRWKTFNPYKGQ